VCGDKGESLASLRAMSASTVPVGVAPLIGVTAVCRHFIPLSLCLVVVSEQKFGSKLDRRNGGILIVVPPLGASYLETWLGVHWCFPSMLAVVEV
jgi:hypothetical protein